MTDLSKTTMREELIALMLKKSFKYSEKPVFRLVSGRMSDFYINCKPTILHPKGMLLVGNLVFEAVRDLNIDGIGGLTFGADPIAVAAAYASAVANWPFNAFSIRKEQKDHGIVKWIEGDMNKGDRVAIIDDVITTGGSTIKAIERARSEGLKVVRVITLVDRQEGGVEEVKKHVEDVVHILNREDFMGAIGNAESWNM